MTYYLFRNMPHGKTKNGAKINTKSHHDYICREGKYAKLNRNEDLVHKASGNLPEWSKDSRVFWEAAEDQRRANGRAYREFTIGLQEELTLQENIELVKELLKRTNIQANHVYTYAIHDKPAAFEPEHRNIHCHLMFNEKVLEKNRPLGKEKFFGKYVEDDKGNAIAGYRSERKWTTKATNLELRRTWAKIVNEKFAEKEMENRIDERNITEQYEEKVRERDFLAADMLKREPCKRLGKAFSNQQMRERIREKVKDAEEYVQGKKESYDTETDDIKQAKINNIAIDIVFRRLAKELQNERIHQKQNDQTEQHQSDGAQNAAHKEEPYVITIGDLKDRVEEKKIALQEKISAYREEYKNTKKQIIPVKMLRIMAEKELFNGKYAKAKHEYAEISKKHAATVQALNRTIAAKASAKDDDYMEQSALLAKYEKEKLHLGESIGKYRTKLNTPEGKEELERIETRLKQEQDTKQQTCSGLYGKIKYMEKQGSTFDMALEQLREFKENEVVFTDKIPKQLNRYTKLYGSIPVKDLNHKIVDGSIYYMVDESDKNNIKAVKQHDDIVQGEVPVYVLQKENDSDKYNSSKIPETIPVYKSKRKDYSRTYYYENRFYKGRTIPEEKRSSTSQTKSTNTNALVETLIKALNNNKKIEKIEKGKFYLSLKENDYEQIRNEAEKADKEMADWGRNISL